MCNQGQLKEALDALHAMDQRALRRDPTMFDSLLRCCIDKKSLSEGKIIHTHMVNMGFKPDLYIGNMLLNMYFKRGRLVDAHTVLDEIPKRNVVLWTTVIATYSSHGRSKEALELFNNLWQT